MAPYLFALVLIVFTLWLAMLALLLLRIGLYKTSWHNIASQPTPQDALVYVVLGDSTAQGVGARQLTSSYPYRVAMWLQKQTGRPVAIKNFSVSGATVADVVRTQLPLVQMTDIPNVISVSVGANDIAKFVAEKFETDMRTLLSALPKETYFALIPTFSGRHSKLNWKVQEANKITKRLIASTNHHIVDIYTATGAMKGFGLHAADFYHPSTKAYKTWAFTFQATMAERIPELISQKR